ncbi:MAG: extracellular solute-binding protein [Pseudomonadota bacterium]
MTSKAKTAELPGSGKGLIWLTSGAVLAAGLAWGIAAHAQDVTVSHGISTFGDLKYPADFKHWDYVNPDAPQGGTISFLGTGASGTFDSLNPFILKGEPAQGLGLMYDSMLTGSGDEADSSYCYVCETMEYPADRSWVIFNMRPEATFSDGHPITADDIVFSYEVLMEKGHPVYKIIYKDIESVEKLGDHKVKFTFKEGVNTRDLPATAGGLSILPEHYYEENDFAESGIKIPVVSGGFIATDVNPGRSIKYCKVPNYWGVTMPHSIGTGNFECYLYEYFADRTVALEAFKAGEFLFHEEFFSKLWATGYDFPAINKGWVIKESIPDERPSGTQGFWINTRYDRFSDPRVRKALGMAFNFEWSNRALFYGLYTRTDSFWENSNMQAEGAPQGAELALLEKYRDSLPPEVFEEAYVPPVAKADKADRRVLRRASKLLDEAGWNVGDDGLRRNAAGETLKLTVVDDSPAFERIINPFVENLRRIGVDASYQLIDRAQMQQRQEDFDYDMIPGRLVMSLSPGEELASTFGTDGANTPGSSNFSGVSHPAIDGLIKDIASAQTREDMEVAVRALDRVLRGLHIWVPNWFKASHNIAYWDVFGRPDTKPKYGRGVIGTWWIDQPKLDKLKADGALR